VAHRSVIRAILFAALLACIACHQSSGKIDGIRIAFLSDVHLGDVYASFDDAGYKGIEDTVSGKNFMVRTMKSQLKSTRVFNENYYAFLAALDDVVRRNIKLVVLPGDFSDDGQPYNLKALERILERYSVEHGIRFFAISGNHDPVAPFTIDGGKYDYLGSDGRQQPVFSAFPDPVAGDANPVILTSEVRKLGYEDIVNIMGRNGLMPQKDYVYWETPFSTYKYEQYSYDRAVAESAMKLRMYAADSAGVTLPDVSYLVEPVEGLWMLAVDGNVFIPAVDGGFSKAPLAQGGEYSNILAFKRHLTLWISRVADEAKKRGKTLISFTHYPMVDFHDNASNDLKSLFGKDKMQLFRVPDDSIAAVFAGMGIKIHFAGHLHVNDTGFRDFGENGFIVNVQVPSLAGYPAAYKILTIRNKKSMEVETARIDSVPGFDGLFRFYGLEHAYLQSVGDKDVWNSDILKSESYGEFIGWHLRELVRLRFVPRDWPVGLKELMMGSDGLGLLKYCGASVSDSLAYSQWTGFDMIVDFYRLANGDQLAVKDIGLRRLSQYKTIIDAALSGDHLKRAGDDKQYADFVLFTRAMRCFLDGAEPSDHFIIDMDSGSITDVAK